LNADTERGCVGIGLYSARMNIIDGRQVASDYYRCKVNWLHYTAHFTSSLRVAYDQYCTFSVHRSRASVASQKTPAWGCGSQ